MTNKSLSLDELVRANKDQFDRIFNDQMQQANLQDSLEATRSEIGVTRGSQPSVVSASDSNIVNTLNQQFGDDWSHDLIEHTTTGNEVRVVCRLQASGMTQTHSGTAQINGNIGIAVQRATDNALARCFADINEASITSANKTEIRTPVGDAAPTRTAVPTATTPLQPGRRARPDQPIDTVTLDLIENALSNARHEMDAVLFRSAMSPVIREQHDEFPMITDPKGRMIVGQFGSYVAEMLREKRFDLAPGDIILQSDPYQCGGAVSHINDWLVLIPIFHNDTLVGFSSMFGHMMDVGGSVAGSMPTTAQSIFGEGIRIPPIKLYDRGLLNKAALDLVLNNTRTPDMNYSDLMAIIAGSRAGEKRVIEICQRFGTETYFQACEELLLRTNRAMRQLIVQNLPTEPKSFED